MTSGTVSVQVLKHPGPPLDHHSFANTRYTTLYTFMCDCDVKKAVCGPLYPDWKQEEKVNKRKQEIRATCEKCMELFD